MLRSLSYGGETVRLIGNTDWTPVPYCPACGDPIDYCQGHGELTDPWGRRIVDRHYEDDLHDECNPYGCEVAAEAAHAMEEDKYNA